MPLLERLEQTRSTLLAKQNVYQQLLQDTQSLTASANALAPQTQKAPVLGITMEEDVHAEMPMPEADKNDAHLSDWNSDSMCLFSPLQSVQGVEFCAGEVGDSGLPRLSASLGNLDNMAVFAADLRTSLACLDIVSPAVPLCASGVDDSVRYSGPSAGDVDQSLCTWQRLGSGGRYPKDDVHGASTEQSKIPSMLWDSLGEYPGSLRSSSFSSPAPLYAPTSPVRIEADADTARNHLRQRLMERAAAAPQQNSESIYLVEFMENGMEIPCLPTCAKDLLAESAEMHMGRVGNLHEFDWVNVKPSAFGYYITQPKDTVRKIAKKHKLECSEIIERNQHIKKLKVTSKMHEGIIMRI